MRRVFELWRMYSMIGLGSLIAFISSVLMHGNSSVPVRRLGTGPQIEGGTIVVFVPDQDKFIVASDSRAVYVRGKTPPNDDACKIFELQNNLVFAESGSISFEPSIPLRGWNNADEAAAAAKSQTGTGSAQATIDQIADAWAITIRDYWKGLYLVDPQLVNEASGEGEHVLTTGIFAIAKNGEVAFAVRYLIFEGKEPQIVPGHCELGHFCATGEMDIFLSLVAQRAFVLLAIKKIGCDTGLTFAAGLKTP
jgi:hypothetical protein